MYLYLYPGGTLLQKNLLRLEAGYPDLTCHILNNQQVTRTQHTRQKQRRHGGHLPPPQRLEKYRRGLVSSPRFIRDRNNFSARAKGSSSASSFRAAYGQGGRAARGARAAGSKGRGAAPAQPPAAAGGPAARAASAAVP